MYIPVYFIGFLDKWSLFIHEEFKKKVRIVILRNKEK